MRAGDLAVGLIAVEVEDPAWAEVPGVEAVVVEAATAALTHDIPSPRAGDGRARGPERSEGAWADEGPRRPGDDLSAGAGGGGRARKGRRGPSSSHSAPLHGPLRLPRGETDFCVGPVTILLTDDATVRDLNARFRGKDYDTNVLSFPAAPQPGQAGPPPLGDLALAFGVCAAEAAAQGKTLADHLRHLIVHGALHLLGHDHEDDSEAEAMEGLEREILAGLGVADPYGAERLNPAALDHV